jgi:hypothetical protein
MGTRSTTSFVSEWGDNEELCVMYRQYDGYPTGHGRDLLDILKDAVLVNGIPGGDTRKLFNGMGCLAASVIAKLKDGPGGFYMSGRGDREGYHYTIYAGNKIPSKKGFGEDRQINIKVEGYSGTLYDGPVDKFNPEEAEAVEAE